MTLREHNRATAAVAVNSVRSISAGVREAAGAAACSISRPALVGCTAQPAFRQDVYFYVYLAGSECNHETDHMAAAELKVQIRHAKHTFGRLRRNIKACYILAHAQICQDSLCLKDKLIKCSCDHCIAVIEADLQGTREKQQQVCCSCWCAASQQIFSGGPVNEDCTLRCDVLMQMAMPLQRVPNWNVDYAIMDCLNRAV